MNELVVRFMSTPSITILLIILAWGTFAFVLWRLAKKWSGAQNSFDISVIGTIIVLLLHRVLYVILYVKEFSSSYWKIQELVK